MDNDDEVLNSDRNIIDRYLTTLKAHDTREKRKDLERKFPEASKVVICGSGMDVKCSGSFLHVAPPATSTTRSRYLRSLRCPVCDNEATVDRLGFMQAHNSEASRQLSNKIFSFLRHHIAE